MIMHVSHGRGLLCVLTLIGPLFNIFLGEEVMKILVIQVDSQKQFP